MKSWMSCWILILLTILYLKTVESKELDDEDKELLKKSKEHVKLENDLWEKDKDKELFKKSTEHVKLDDEDKELLKKSKEHVKLENDLWNKDKDKELLKKSKEHVKLEGNLWKKLNKTKMEQNVTDKKGENHNHKITTEKLEAKGDKHEKGKEHNEGDKAGAKHSNGERKEKDKNIPVKTESETLKKRQKLSQKELEKLSAILKIENPNIKSKNDVLKNLLEEKSQKIIQEAFELTDDHIKSFLSLCGSEFMNSKEDTREWWFTGLENVNNCFERWQDVEEQYQNTKASKNEGKYGNNLICPPR